VVTAGGEAADVAAAAGAAVTVCVFARAPRLGQVKRRLAQTLGEQAALQAHCRLVEDTLSRLAQRPEWRCELWIDATSDDVCSSWARRYGVCLHRQQGSDLGARMGHALTSALHDSDRAVLVGSDCPPIDGHYVASAVAALDLHDAVLGPASDGGYGLIGWSRPVSAMLVDIDWGTDRVLAQTLAAAAAADVTVALLPEIWDVDTAADWERYRRLS
jgi:uncharacterized protein